MESERVKRKEKSQKHEKFGRGREEFIKKEVKEKLIKKKVTRDMFYKQ